MMTIDRFTKGLFRNDNLEKLAHVPVGLLMLFAASQISIPIQPVPITLQTAAVLLIALTFERQAALMTITSYIALGAVGAPMFAGFSGGAHIILGPAGGYIAGFALAIWIMTSPMVDGLRNRGITSTFLLSLIGQSVIFALGLIWLSKFVGVSNALAFGFYPFIIPGIVKCVLLSLAIKACKDK